MQTAQDVYTSTIRNLPRDEQLRLAALILNALTQPEVETADYSDEWSEEDLREATIYFMKQADERYPEEHDLV